ncbi:MAG: hypothetical protein SFU85_08855 [Candidatus Methylacidiphilales bacterium]|nr:hypothetical protein [Candidatus Methylacidiphilales bacterium]
MKNTIGWNQVVRCIARGFLLMVSSALVVGVVGSVFFICRKLAAMYGLAQWLTSTWAVSEAFFTLFTLALIPLHVLMLMGWLLWWKKPGWSMFKINVTFCHMFVVVWLGIVAVEFIQSGGGSGGFIWMLILTLFWGWSLYRNLFVD